MTAGDIILMARRRARLSQRELAERVGCRQATIARWERGDRQATFEDVQQAISACGLALDVHLAREDRSWWPQIASQLDLSPSQRVRRLTPPGGADALPVLRVLAETRSPVVVIGEVAGALQGSPLVLDSGTVEVCVRGDHDVSNAAFEALNAREIGDGVYECSGGIRLVAMTAPAGTSGYADVARGADLINIDGDPLLTASLIDLLRIADASPDIEAPRHALALRAVLDVHRSRERASRGRHHDRRIGRGAR